MTLDKKALEQSLSFRSEVELAQGLSWWSPEVVRTCKTASSWCTLCFHMAVGLSWSQGAARVCKGAELRW